MDFESPDVAKEFPGLYASESLEQDKESDSDTDGHDKHSKKELLIGKKKDKKESKKDKGYVAFEGESSDDNMEESKSPTKGKKSKTSFKFPGPKKDKSKEKTKEPKEPKKDKESKEHKKESKELKKEKEKETKENKKEKEKETKENKKEKVKIKRKEKRKSKLTEDGEDRAIFGVPLQVAVERNKCHDGIQLPVIVRECIDYIEEHGLSCEGIYRLSGVKSKVQHIKHQYDNGEKVYLYEHEPHVVASVLKLFMRELPEPVLTSDLNQRFDEASALKSESARESKLLDLITKLPLPNRLLLSWVFIHMTHVIAREQKNKMSLQNVAIVLSPTMQISHRAINVLFQHSDALFKGVEIRKYVPPIRPQSSRLSLELPDTPTAIEEELKKQESLLNQLHAELNAGVKDSGKEEELWEVQRVVTQLKRKLRFAKRPPDSTEPAIEKKVPTSIEEEIVIDTRLQQVNDDGDKPEDTQTKDENELLQAQTGKEEISNTVSEQKSVPDEIQIDDTQGNTDNELEKSTEAVEIEKCTENSGQEMKDSKPVTELNKAAQSECINNEAEEKETVEELKEDDELVALIEEKKRVKLENVELKSLGEDLKKKIESERSEAERLLVEINALQKIYRYRGVSFDSEDNSSNSSDGSDSENEDELMNKLELLERENQDYKKKNKELIEQIQREREACLSMKVQIRIMNENANHIPVC